MAFGRETDSPQHSSSSLAPLALHLHEQNRLLLCFFSFALRSQRQWQNSIERCDLKKLIFKYFLALFNKIVSFVGLSNEPKLGNYYLQFHFNFHCASVVETEESFNSHNVKILKTTTANVRIELFLAHRFRSKQEELNIPTLTKSNALNYT